MGEESKQTTRREGEEVIKGIGKRGGRNTERNRKRGGEENETKGRKTNG